MSDGEVLIRAEHVSKKFCRSLKRSLWYGAQDVANSLMPWKRDSGSTGTNDDMVFREPELRKDEFWAVRDVSFEVRRGECLGLIGHNGAGKSTLLKMLNSLNRPDSGRITIKGRVGAIIELNAGFNPVLSGRENIYNQATLLGFSKYEIAKKFDEIVIFSELESFLDMPVQNYSSGMRIRLGFSISALLQPDVLLLDEVLAVGDIGFTLKCLNRIGQLMPDTATIFISHNMQLVARVCTVVMLLEAGKSKLTTHDVAAGIQSYLALYSGLEFRELGNGAVGLAKLDLAQMAEMGLNRSQVTEQLPFENGNTLCIGMSFDIKMPITENVFAIVKVLDQQLRECVNCFSHDGAGTIFSLNTGTLRVEVEIPSLYLNGGLHYLSISIEGLETRRIYCHASNVEKFLVRSNIQGWATSTIPGKWSVAT